MNRLERFILRWIFGRLIHQSKWSGSNIQEIYKLVYKQTMLTFLEDNAATRDYFLQQQFDQAKRHEQ